MGNRELRMKMVGAVAEVLPRAGAGVGVVAVVGSGEIGAVAGSGTAGAVAVGGMAGAVGNQLRMGNGQGVLQLFIVGLLLLAFPAWGQTGSTPADTTPGNKPLFQGLSVIGTDPQAWGLNQEDWLKYQALMRSEAGLYYAHLEPAWILGMYESDSDLRDQYITIAVMRDQARNTRLMSFNRAFVRTRERLFVNEPVVNEALFQQRMAALGARPSAVPGQTGRIRAYVKIFDCARCERSVKRFARQGQRADIFILDANSQGDIQQWASRLALPVELVNSGVITLNFDDGTYSRLNTQDLPHIIPIPAAGTQ